MPRSARLDVLGVVQHVMARGIEGREIFGGDRDREAFLDRLASVITTGGAQLLGWSLMSNHFHLVAAPEALPQGHHASTDDRLRRVVQPPTRASRASVPEPVPEHRRGRGALPARVDPLRSSESAARRGGQEPRITGPAPLRGSLGVDGISRLRGSIVGDNSRPLRSPAGPGPPRVSRLRRGRGGAGREHPVSGWRLGAQFRGLACPQRAQIRGARTR